MEEGKHCTNDHASPHTLVRKSEVEMVVLKERKEGSAASFAGVA